MVGRADQHGSNSPQLIADVTLYPSSGGGRKSPILPGWGCLCCVSEHEPIAGYGGFPLLGEAPMQPGERRRLGFVFLMGETAARIIQNARKFSLWEGSFVGEAVVIPSTEL